MHLVVPPCPNAADNSSKIVRRLGRQSIRPAPFRNILQELHRENLGDELPRNLRGLGGPADQGTFAKFKHRECSPACFRAKLTFRCGYDVDRQLSLSSAWSRYDVGDLRRESSEARRRNSPWAQGCALQVQ